MPLRIVCAGCGELLFEGKDFPKAVSSHPSIYESVRKQHRFRCPKCGRPLPSEPSEIAIEGERVWP